MSSWHELRYGHRVVAPVSLAVTPMCLVVAAAVSAAAPALAQSMPAYSIIAAQDSPSTKVQQHRVTLVLKNAKIADALDQIAAQSGLALSWSRAKVPLSGTVTLSLHNVPVREALAKVLHGTNVEATISSDGQAIYLKKKSENDASDHHGVGVIEGQVSDSASGKKLSGATVKVSGSNLSTVTTDSGRFTLRNVPAGERVLTVRLFGYHAANRTVTVADSEHVTIRIQLTSIPTVLSGVVTTATGTQRKIEVGNDITTLNVDSIMQTAPIHNVTDLLATRVPGLTVVPSSGVPGAPSRLRLRGVGGGLVTGSSNLSNDPIVFVDGVRVYARTSTNRDISNTAEAPFSGGAPLFTAPSALDQIDPNTIEKIEVFKGPSASALYGSEAGNGVIVITTKRGRPGPTHISASVDYGLQYMPGVYAPDNVYLFGHGGGFTSSSTLCTLESIQQAGVCTIIDSLVPFQALNEPSFSQFTTGTNSGASMTVGGGAGTFAYSLTGSGSGQLGYIKMPDFYQRQFTSVYDQAPPSWMKRPDRYNIWSGNGSVTAVPYNGLRVSVSALLSKSTQQQSSGQNQLSTLANTYLDTANLGLATLGQYVQRVTSTSLTSTNALSADWAVTPHTALHGSAGINTIDRQDRSLIPFGFANVGDDTTGTFSMGHNTSEDHTLNLNAAFTQLRRVTTTVGIDIHQATTQDFRATADSLSAGVTTPTNFNRATQTSASLTTAGWFVEPRLNFNSRFFAAPGFRFDGGTASSSKGGVNGGLFSLFPRLDFSWIAVDREDQKPLGGFLTLFRPRLALGVAGVQPDPSWKLRLSATPASQNNQLISTGLLMTSLGNVDLHPERSREVEGGFDMQMWGNRVSLTASHYNKLRIDAITPIVLAPSIYGGGLPFYVNLGRIQNTGNEVSLSVQLIQTAAMSWEVSARYSNDDNKLVTLNGGINYFNGHVGTGQRFVPGYPVNGQWARPILGFTPPANGARLSLSDVVLGDSSVYLGQESPKYQLPFSTSLALWHGMVSVNANFDYQNGLTQLNTGDEQSLANLYFNPQATLGEQAAALEAAALASATLSGGGTPYGIIQTVNFLRFSSLSVGYRIPSSWTRHLRVPQATVALQGSNLGLWSNYRGKDPSVNALTVGDQLQDTGLAPTPRVWSIHVSLGNN